METKLVSNPLKTIFVEGNLSKDLIFKKHLPSENGILTTGNWNFCLSNLTFLINHQTPFSISEFINITTNLISAYQENITGSHVLSYVPIQRFHLQGEAKTKKLINFDKTWFNVNSASDSLKIFLKFYPDNGINMNELDIDFQFTFLYYRMI